MTVYDHIADAASYTSRRYRTNHHRHWWGIAHRARLIDSGEYVKTSEQSRYVFRQAVSAKHVSIWSANK